MSNEQPVSASDRQARPPAAAAALPDQIGLVLRLLRRINHAADLHSKHLIKATGLTTPQLIVLKAIHELGEVTAGAVAEHVSLSQGTVSMILDRLESHALIERYRSVRDRRIVHARLTPAGAQVVARAPPLLREKFIERFAVLSGEQQVQTLQALAQVADMMDAEDGAENPI